ncbi:MAG: diguanylate cyclase domain-containing protein [Acholeplasmataceae bacterium]|jgi:diguanylate cyclase (GGDEF)-like protein
MTENINDIKKYIDDTTHHIVFDYELGRVVCASANIKETYLASQKEPLFNSFFPELKFEEVKEKLIQSERNNIKVKVHIGTCEMPFEIRRVTSQNKEYILGKLLVESVFFGTFADKFDLVRRQDFFLTAYIDENFKIVGCSKKYKATFEKVSDKIIGASIYHNIVNYRPYIDIIRLKEIFDDHLFWYGVAIVKERDNIFAPYILTAYNREAPIIKAKYEVHFFPVRYFGNETIFQYDFYSKESVSVYTRIIFEGIVHKYLAANDNDKYLLFMDVNNFKCINDTYGHDCGDKVLREITEILSIVFKDYVVSRYGGDEFAVYIDKTTSKEKIIELIEEAEAQINQRVGDKFVNTPTHISVGISKYKENGTTLNELIHEADIAMYKAKREGSLYRFSY